MDAIEFLKERVRMCKSYKDSCDDCELYKISKELHMDCIKLLDCHFETAVKTVDTWSFMHPKKTMRQDFFEKHPNAPTKNDMFSPIPCPEQCGYEKEKYCIKNNKVKNCVECWSRPLEE